MINFESFQLDNGLRVIVHEDPTIQTAVLNLMYDVGSKDEDPEKTGFAHLFEHLMFGGSKHIKDFDKELQKVGGDNNAFTSPDLTNYYITVPASNLESAFWLESDRMLSLSFDPNVLEVQRKVVIEEFKQNYLNQPYGDLWLKFRPLCFEKHPYQWATIGKKIAHIEEATMEDVKSFFAKFYVPNNAVLVVGGNVSVSQVKALAEKWFGPIPSGVGNKRKLPVEPVQVAQKTLLIEDKVPASLYYQAFHMCGRSDQNYHATDLLSDVLGRGKSSRLHQKLVEESQLFNSISAHVSGSTDPGLLIIGGYLHDGIEFEQAEEGIGEVIGELKKDIREEELEKVKNQAISTLEFDQVEVLERCINLAHHTLLGNTNGVNEEVERIKQTTASDVLRMANEVLTKENSNILKYKAV